jgi:tetratricopeptide (TPR) repeat protein
VRESLRFVRVVVAVGLLVGGAQLGLAAPATTADVEKLIKKGTDLRKQGQEQAALPLFQKAYELAATPRTAAQLGLCEMQLGYWLAAESHLSEALEGKSDWIERYRPVLQQSVRQVRKQLGEVFVSGSPADARVSINGRVQAGALPWGRCG